MPTVSRSALTAQVYEAVHEPIMDQVLAPGQRLTIASLARRLSVSETPVREALGRLHAERLVTFEPYVGFTVGQLLTRERFNQMLDVRTLLEGHAARLGALVATDELLEQMRRAVVAMEHLRAGPTFQENKDYSRSMAPGPPVAEMVTATSILPRVPGGPVSHREVR